ncbi:MAG TPA: thermonuclease family protein [Pyrinomonadaceae bacterium]|nr:thermonuclease family protein [Pyrinomonadaceae bacterium]
MRTFLIAFLILFVCFAAKAQDTQTKEVSSEDAFEYDCEPNNGDIGYVEDGKIIKIIDEDTVAFRSDKGLIRQVNLIGINSKKNKTEAKAFLEKNVLNVQVALIFRSFPSEKVNVKGIIQIDKKNINQMMIEQGFALYKNSKPYQISSYDACVFQKSEEKAKKAKLGIWAK